MRSITHMATETSALTTNERLLSWVEEVVAAHEPDSVHWCDGSAEEYDRLCQEMVEAGHVPAALGRQAAELLPRLVGPRRRGPGRGPHVHLLRARGGRGADQPLGGPARRCARSSRSRFSGAMKGRTMYVVPFSMGPLGSPISEIGVQLTDSPYVAVSMRIMTRMGAGALDALGEDGDVRAVPALGRRAAGRGREQPPGRATRRSTSSTSPRRARSGPTARATAATRCWARSASRCGSPRSWRATRAGWPSTC